MGGVEEELGEMKKTNTSFWMCSRHQGIELSAWARDVVRPWDGEQKPKNKQTTNKPHKTDSSVFHWLGQMDT